MKWIKAPQVADLEDVVSIEVKRGGRFVPLIPAALANMPEPKAKVKPKAKSTPARTDHQPPGGRD